MTLRRGQAETSWQVKALWEGKDPAESELIDLGDVYKADTGKDLQLCWMQMNEYFSCLHKACPPSAVCECGFDTAAKRLCVIWKPEQVPLVEGLFLPNWRPCKLKRLL
ncbi:hypothetical protein AK812_SmicGene11854 [Symbiodinium microadriaticum]|uniref:Uncharacterized protein n=1 Tax=Symbiodinium microadriaticum TaxID=2951 RepID=A0A1Q9EC37_SYMMI|nr:hypothetical protein AK812_SmicGene11854 [Symbiodinium microadriaticum]